MSGKNIYIAGTVRYGLNDNYILLKYNESGDLVWGREYDYGISDKATGLATSSGGYVYITGTSMDVTDDYATLKYDENGNLLWVRRYNNPASGQDFAYCITADLSGNVYVSGSAANDITTIKYDATGNLTWQAAYNGIYNGNDIPVSMSMDNENNIYITGLSTPLLTKEGDIVTLGYNDAGVLQWAENFNAGHGRTNMGYDLAVSQNRNVYITGTVYNGSNYDIATIKFAQCAATAGLKNLFAGDEKLETKPKENPVEEKTSFIRLFPNPNDGNVTMEYSLSTGNDGRFVIRNPQGVEVANYILSAKNKIAWINNDMLDNGVYIYTIYEGESVIETGKIIIVK